MQDMPIIIEKEVSRKAQKKARRAIWLLNNKERVKKSQAIWREKNREHLRAVYRERYQAQIEVIRAKRNARRKTDKGIEIRAKERAYRTANIESVNARHRKWQEEHRESRRQYIQANPVKLRSWDHRRKARKKAALGKWTSSDIQVLHAKQRGICEYCQREYGASFEVDHVIPLSKGGTNWPSNIVIACKTCNRSKGAKLVFQPMFTVGV